MKQKRKELSVCKTTVELPVQGMGQARQAWGEIEKERML